MKRLTRWDAIAAAALFLIVILLGAGLLDRGHEWGDDFAAYMLQARAIANGTMEEQSRLNRIIHPSELSFGGEEDPETITYVWGYPLALAGVYKLVGYDPAEGGIPLAYKLPNLIAYALFAVVVYLFYRRRFSFEGSLFLSLLFALHTQMLAHVNTLMSDVFCLTLSMAALLLIEIFLECGIGKKKACIGVLLGAVLWYNYEVRLNGVTVIYIVIFAHAINLLRSRPAKREWAVQLTPYAALLVLLGISLCVMPQATSNSSHIASGPNSWIIYNLRYYSEVIRDWLYGMLPGGAPEEVSQGVSLRACVPYAVYVCILLGVLRAGITRNLHLTALMFGTFAVVLLLPYAQPIRYLFNALPLMLMFAAYGAQMIWTQVLRWPKGKALRVVRFAGYAAMLVCVAGMTVGTVEEIGEHIRLGGTEYRYGAYCDDALEVYTYIREHADEDDVIACMKPRATMLNTDRLCYAPGINGNQYKDLDYLLAFKKVEIKGLYDFVTEGVWPELWAEMTEVCRNESFVLYKRVENVGLSGESSL